MNEDGIIMECVSYTSNSFLFGQFFRFVYVVRDLQFWVKICVAWHNGVPNLRISSESSLFQNKVLFEVLLIPTWHILRIIYTTQQLIPYVHIFICFALSRNL